MENYKPGISFCAGNLMLKWNLLDNIVRNHPIRIMPGDNVNVFINFETILRNLSMQKGINELANFHKQKTVLDLESSILNLMAHYKMYFNKEKCNVKLYYYLTDLNENDQQMEVYNKHYRNYYHNKYIENPQFKSMGLLMKDSVIPETDLILSYVNGCYLLKSKMFDSSIIPYIVSTFSCSKNVIITGDIFDTLYMINPNFLTVYIKRRFTNFSVMSDLESTIQSIVKDESVFDLNIFNSELYYRLLLSIKGNKIRNIRSAKGFGYGKFMKLIKEAMNDDIILRDFKSIDSVIEFFPEQYREDIKLAFQCTDIETQYNLLNDSDIENIKSQIVDKSDIQSLEALNNKRFLESPINLQGLIY